MSFSTKLSAQRVGEQDGDAPAWGSADPFSSSLVGRLEGLLCKDSGREDVEAFWTNKFLEAWLAHCEASESVTDIKKADLAGIEKDPVSVGS